MGPLDRKSKKENARDQQTQQHQLILHNDDINSFEHVMFTLQEICDHDEIQSEQCAIITHMKGYCEIKRGLLTELEEMQNILKDFKLKVTID